MVRSPSGRAHCCTREEFDRELDRIEFELAAQDSKPGRLSVDAVFAKCGFYTDSGGRFVDVESGATPAIRHS